MDREQARNALWLLLRLGTPQDQSPEFQRAWFEGVLSMARAFGYDFGPEEFARLDHAHAFFEYGAPENFEEWATRLATNADEEEENRYA